METVQYKNLRFQVWDLGGQVRPRPNPNPNPNPKPNPKPNPNPNQVIKAPIIPVIKNPLDTSNYEHYEDEDGTDWARYNDKKKNVFAAF